MRRTRYSPLSRLAALLLVLWLCPGALAQQMGLQVLQVQELASGLSLSTCDLPAEDGSGLMHRLYVLEVDPKAASGASAALGLRDGRARGLETVQAHMEQAAQALPGQPLIGINGDFFDMATGGGLGLSIQDGRLLTSGEFPQGWSLGIGDGLQARIGQPQLSLTFSAARDGRSIAQAVPIDALNHLRSDVEPHRSSPPNAFAARQDNRLVLYTADYYRATMQRDGGYEVRLKVDGQLVPGQALQGEVVGIHRTGKVTTAGSGQVPQGSKLGEGYAVLSAAGAAVDLLRPLKTGDSVVVAAALSGGWEGMMLTLGGGRPDGGPLLLKDGIIQPEHPEVDDYGYFYGPNARTAAGIREDGTWFLLVVQGSRVEGAGGLSIAQLARLMRSLGAAHALNLDGGPSSTLVLWAGGKPVQLIPAPPRKPAKVGNSLIFYSTGE